MAATGVIVMVVPMMIVMVVVMIMMVVMVAMMIVVVLVLGVMGPAVVDAALERGSLRRGDLPAGDLFQGFLDGCPARDVEGQSEVGDVLPGVRPDVSADDAGQMEIQEATQPVLGKFFRVVSEDLHGPVVGVHDEMGGGVAEAPGHFGVQVLTIGGNEVLHVRFPILATRQGSCFGLLRAI